MNIHHSEIYSSAGESSASIHGSGNAARAKRATGANAKAAVRKPVTMAKIAAAAGVSQGAISSLLNDRDYGIRVSAQTSERVFKVCREMGYIPSDLRAVVRVYPEMGESCLLVSGKVPGGLSNPFVSRVAAALMEESAGQPASLSVALYDEARDYTAGAGMPAAIKSGLASKVIFVGTANHSIVAMARHRGNPTILLGHSAVLDGTTSVIPDYHAAVRSALALFARHGHKSVGIIGGSFASDEPRITELYCAIGSAVHDSGMPIEAHDIHCGRLDFECGVEGLNSMIDRASRPTALLCLSEATAAGVVAGARARGIAVPGELSIIAFTDHEGPPAACLPVTSVVLPARRLAAVAMEEATRQIVSGVPTEPHKVVVPTTLIERMTCGPAPR